MERGSPNEKQLYKVKLASGRVLGPIDIARIRALILKKKITGQETARPYPNGEWADINQIAPIAELLLAHGLGKLNKETKTSGYRPILGELQAVDNVGATKILDEEIKPLPGSEGAVSLPSKMLVPEEATEVASSGGSFNEDPDRTRVEIGGINNKKIMPLVVRVERREPTSKEKLAQQATVFFDRGNKGEKKRSSLFRIMTIGLVLVGVGLEMLPDKNDVGTVAPREQAVRPHMPNPLVGQADPAKSTKTYNEGLKFYLLDHVVGYRRASQYFQTAASLDPGNVKALAFLASSYLNLIDSSNKDDRYFTVISQLIDLTRAKSVDLPETVIADVEFFLTVNKAEAAQTRIANFVKTHQSIGLEIYYYLSSIAFSRGEYRQAAEYAAKIPDNKAFSVKVFYLRGQTAEKLGDLNAAKLEYEKALKANKEHAKSHLRIAYLLSKQGSLKDASSHLDFAINHPGYLPPKELGLAYSLHAQLSELYSKFDVALVDMERAVRLDSDNHDYLIELYTLRAKEGDSSKQLKVEARMYYFLGQGEKEVLEGRYQEALIQFLQARHESSKSLLPLVKIGDMFKTMHDLGNALLNYKQAAELAPTNVAVWSKYIDTLIQSFEWDEAQKAMEKFRKLPVNQSFIDKLAADMYEKQGLHNRAQAFYKKAMSRESIDTSVYLAYAKSLLLTKNFKEAPFFFALTRRFDPSSMDAITGTAKCIAATESIDRAIEMLQDELQKQTGARGELLAAIADLQTQRGDWDLAQQTVEQAMSAAPDLAQPWKIQAQIYMNKEGLDKNALDKALLAYKAYSDRNTSDPSGYLERYRIYIKKTDFEKADAELAKIYGIYPKYPNLHYFKGALYGTMGNHKRAIEEFKTEVTNNSNNASAYVAWGKELIEVGAVQDAVTQFSKAMQLAPQAAEPKLQAGYANYLLKNYQASVALYSAALAIDSGNSLLYKRLGWAYRDMGNGPGAADAFRKYIQLEPDAPDRAQYESYR